MAATQNLTGVKNQGWVDFHAMEAFIKIVPKQVVLCYDLQLILCEKALFHSIGNSGSFCGFCLPLQFTLKDW